MKNKYELALQISLILICLVVLSLRWSSTPTKAQGSCGGEPPLMAPNNPKSRAWPQGKSFAVVVFEPTTESEFQQIRDGVLDWNSHSIANCSGVTFPTVTQSQTPFDPDARPNDDIVWYFRANQGSQFLPEFRFIGGTQQWEIKSARVRIQVPTPNDLKKVSTHELGHGFGLAQETFPPVAGRSIMGSANQITSCDTDAIKRVYCPAPTPTQTPTPSPTPTPDECDPAPGIVYLSELPDASDLTPPGCCDPVERILCQMNGGTWVDWSCTCVSPIVIDVAGNGFNLSNAQNGVLFDIVNDGIPRQVSWTSANSDDAWLALDRNGNGRIDKGRELFGSSTPQPRLQAGESKNGFRALAVFDRIQRGGNNDGQIDHRDAVFSDLRLWQDMNHNGISEPGELHSVSDLGLRSIDLEYHESRRQDENGNWFRFRARVRDISGAQMGRWAWDVFLDVEEYLPQRQ